MYNPNLKLTEIFESNTLRNMTTEGNNPMPHRGNTYYISGLYNLENNLIKELLEKGNKWKAKSSVSSYIDLTEKAAELVSNRLIQYGPQSNSSSFKIEFRSPEEGKIRILAQGWGTSSIELYDGEEKYFLQYLLDHQKRE